MATIALDIGGTKIASAIFMPDGSMLYNRRKLLKGKTGSEVGEMAAEILTKLLTFARRSLIPIENIGVCIPGIVYSQTGRVWAPNIPGWDNYPLRAELEACVKNPRVKLYIDSDRNCYMYGELWKGVARDCHSAVFMAVGTGIGAGIIIDGKVLHGAGDIVGAVGWSALQPPYTDKYDACGCFEYYASGNGIGDRARDAVRADKSYRGKLRQKPITRITSQDVFSVYEEGDPIAVAVIDKAIEMWGMAAANLVSILNPQMIIWGGGVFGPAAGFIERIYNEALKWAQPISIRQAEFVATGLSGHAGLTGAAYMAIRNYESEVSDNEIE
ncbi:ROK family protein [Bacteroides sp. 214]|uniref:ROK family protein n=1 Tax=Bacteroides sp. 214 TaxID=2302935 RepID=UPI0013D22486|nr:ROK family protein [Bacteroides sp. 214]NDW12997.1 ROK family protein [Bacteroides sp. 214]